MGQEGKEIPAKIHLYYKQHTIMYTSTHTHTIMNNTRVHHK